MYGKVNIKKTVTLIFLLLFSLSFCLAHDGDKSHYVYLQDPADLINPNGFYEYMIIKDDYLSHLAYKFYHDGLRWPKIYKANPYIIDPNWIYPDNWLVIPEIYFDESGNPISKERSFTYESTGEVINNAMAKSRIADVNLLYENDKSGKSQVRNNNDKNFDKTTLPDTETHAIESNSEINEKLENDAEKTIQQLIINLDKRNIDSKAKASAKHSYSNNPNWVIGLVGGYPFGDVPDEDDNLEFGLLIGTPLRIILGPISARLGVGIIGFNFTDKIYPGAGLLLNLAISELLEWTTPVQLQVHGTGFYIPDGSIGKGILGSVSVPLGDSPYTLGIYVGMGDYDSNNSVKSIWKNTGLLLQLQL